MDFLNRNTNQPQANRAASPAGASVAPVSSNERKNDPAKRGYVHQPRWVRVAFMILLVSVTIVAVGALWLLHVGGTREEHYVDTSMYQSVSLSNGQMFIGKIKDLNSKYLVLDNVFYLNTANSNSANGSSSATNTSNSTDNSFQLIKAGCEVHGPTDQWVINRDQVAYWENLKTDGQVAKGIVQWYQQNPNGQVCKTTTPTTSSNQSSTNATSNTNNSSTSNTQR